MAKLKIKLKVVGNCLDKIEQSLSRQEVTLQEILMSQADLAVQLNAQADQVEKVKGEVQNLLDVIAAQNDVSPELQAAADRLAASIQGVDDLNPDVPIENPVQ